MKRFLKCRSCGYKFLSPIEEPVTGFRGSPGIMVIACPRCARNVDMLIDLD